MKTRSPLLLMCLSLCIFSCIGQEKPEMPNEFKVSKDNYSFMQVYSTPAPVLLTLATSGGNIKVEGYNGNKLDVFFVVSKNNGTVLAISPEELKKYASYEIKHNGSELTIRVLEIYRRNLNVGFIVRTPQQTTAKLSTSGGNVSIDNLIGNQKLSTSGGNVFMGGITGNLDGSTSGGNIRLENSKGPMNVSTSGGNISGENLIGDLHASTSGGNIRMEDVQGIVDVSTSGGNISLEELSGKVSARTSGGHVHAKLNKLVEGLFLETSGGNIECVLPEGLGLDLNLKAANVNTSLQNFNGTAKQDMVVGQMNGGGVPVEIRTGGGSISLEYQ
jgi:hypothetical protein